VPHTPAKFLALTPSTGPTKASNSHETLMAAIMLRNTVAQTSAPLYQQATPQTAPHRATSAAVRPADSFINPQDALMVAIRARREKSAPAQPNPPASQPAPQIGAKASTTEVMKRTSVRTKRAPAPPTLPTGTKSNSRPVTNVNTGKKTSQRAKFAATQDPQQELLSAIRAKALQAQHHREHPDIAASAAAKVVDENAARLLPKSMAGALAAPSATLQPRQPSTPSSPATRNAIPIWQEQIIQTQLDKTRVAAEAAVAAAAVEAAAAAAVHHRVEAEAVAAAAHAATQAAVDSFQLTANQESYPTWKRAVIQKRLDVKKADHLVRWLAPCIVLTMHSATTLMTSHH
jgi:hypothetical protein